MRTRIALGAVILAAVSVQAHAASRSFTVQGFAVSVEPIVGLEHTHKLAPTPHMKNRLVYGARLTAGVPRISAELEYTRGTDTENYPENDLTIIDRKDAAKLGIRSGITLANVFSLTLRAGGEASRGSRDETRGGMTSTFSQELRLSPYAGTGFNLGVSDKLAASLEVVAIFADVHDLTKTEFQTTAGFSVKFP